MKMISSLLCAALLVWSCSPSPSPTLTPGDPDPTPVPTPTPKPEDTKLCAPEDLTLEVNGDQLTLGWKDVCTLEEGYLVQRTGGGKTTKQFLKRNANSYSEALPGTGVWTYEVFAYSGMDRSEPATVEYSRLSKPELAISSLQASWNMLAAVVTIQEDSGENCEISLNVNGKIYKYPAKLTKGKTALFALEDLEYGVDYSVKAIATNSQGTTESASVKGRLKDAPTALSVSWTEIGAQYSLPSEVRLYKASPTIGGGTVNMWYAIADPSAVELRATLASTVTTPSDHVTGNLRPSDDVYITINGGYFSAPTTSYSHVTDRGVRKAKNIAALTRTNSYNVTRGVLGVAADGKPQAFWVREGSSYAEAYSVPLPVIDGGPVLSCTSTYPSAVSQWKPYAAIGGAPLLMKDGRVRFDFLKTPDGKYFSNHELLQSDIFAEGLTAPRTAIGSTADGKIVLFICDGRNSGGSRGLTLDEEMRVMMGLGCTDILNLDGGGSTAMVVGNNATLLNRPSDGSQRKVLSFVSFIKKK